MQENYSETIPRLFAGVAQTIPHNGFVEEEGGQIKKSKTTLMAVSKAMEEFYRIADLYGDKRKWAVFTVALLALLRMDEEERHDEIRHVLSLTTEAEANDLVNKLKIEAAKARLRKGYQGLHNDLGGKK